MKRQRGIIVGRGGGICELAQGEKWENWSIFPLWILNVYDQTDRDKRREKNIYVHSLYLRLALAWLNPSSNVNSLNFCPAYQVQLSVKAELTWIK